MKSKEEHWDDMYQKPLEQIPWEIERPPKELAHFLSRKKVQRGETALDVACGTGNYSIYLAQRGFAVTGIDFSKKALTVARRRAKDAGQKITFVHGDILNLDTIVKKQFDLILDYSILHHIPFSKTRRYARQFSRLLKPGGKLLLVCYSEKDEDAAGRRMRKGKYGNTMYYRKAAEIRAAYKDLKEIDYKAAWLGKRLHHAGHCFILERPRADR